MAKFGSYFGLCPLIDYRSLLGISEDGENGNVIVTLGKNIAMKYRLRDQKQITSWTTKEKFTSPVIFDSSTQNYVAVINYIFIRCWDSDKSNLDKVKKFKFTCNINSIVVINKMSFVVFETGDIVSIEYALKNNKNFMPEEIIDRKKEYIMDNICCHVKTDRYIGLLIGNSETDKVSYMLWTNFDSVGTRSEYIRLSLKGTCSDLVGCCFHLFDQTVQILTLWSNGELYVKCLEDTSEDLGEMFCIIESVSCKEPLSIVSLDKDYFAIYGGNSNQEGALLIIYNNQFKVTQCMQHFKLLTVGGKIYKIQEKLILPVGQNLAVVPYHLEKEQLSALIGSHISCSNDAKDILVVNRLEELNWNMNENIKRKKSKVYTIIKDYLDQGFPESIIFKELLPTCIENINIKHLKLLLSEFLDIPESCHATVLKYMLELPTESFKKSKKVLDESYPKELQPLERYEILKLILEKPVQEINNNIVLWRLELDNFLKLLRFILFLLKDDQRVDTNFCIQLVKWANLMFCSNFQLFFSSKDERIVDVLSQFDEYINSENLYLNSEFMVEELVNHKKTTITSYTIENIVL